MKQFVALAAAFVLSLPLALQAQANDPLLGTFSLNLTKSTYTPGPPPKSETRTYEAFGTDGTKVRFQRVEANGNTTTVTYSAKYDGKDYPYMGSPDADTISLRRVDRNTVDAVLKKNGKAVQTTHAVVSPDGKTRRLTSNGTRANGQMFMNIAVFDRQTTNSTR